MIKKIPVAYGIKMLQIVCVLEDDKCSSDDIIEKIEKLYGQDEGTSEVQSVDVASLQKV